MSDSRKFCTCDAVCRGRAGLGELWCSRWEADRTALAEARAELERLKASASRYVRAHAGQVVRLQDASRVAEYDDAARALYDVLAKELAS